MDKRYSTIIFVPHARAKFRKLKVSHRLLFSLLSVVTSSLCLSTFFSVQYFTSLSQTHELTQAAPREPRAADRQRAVQQVRRVAPRPAPHRRRPHAQAGHLAGISSLDESAQGGVGGLRPDGPRRQPVPRRRRQDGASARTASRKTSPCSNRSSWRSRSSSPPRRRSRRSAASSPTASAAAPIRSPASRARTTRSTSRPRSDRPFARPPTASWSRPNGPTATAT